MLSPAYEPAFFCCSTARFWWSPRASHFRRSQIQAGPDASFW